MLLLSLFAPSSFNTIWKYRNSLGFYFVDRFSICDGETKKRVFSYGNCIECHYAIFIKNEKAETARVMAFIWLNICSNSFVVSLPENSPDCYKAAFFNNWCLAVIESRSEIRWWEYSQVDSICFCLSCLKESSKIAFRVIPQIKERSIEN